MFQKLPLIIRKYDKGLQVDKRSKPDNNVTIYRAVSAQVLLIDRPASKYQGAIGTAKAKAVGCSIL